MKYAYDIVVIGGGGGGLTASKTAKGLGNKVAIIEKTDRLGGECTWTGCIPSKTIIKTAQVAWHAKHLDTYGLKTNGAPILDTSNVMPYIRAIIQEDYQSHTPKKIEEAGIDVLFGNVRFIDNHTLDLDGRTITFSKAIITTGSSPFVPPIDGLDDVDWLTNENFFSLEDLPPSLLILGGGAIGCEMASALNRLGVTVSLIEMHDRLLPKEDEEVVALLTETMQKEGVKIYTGMKATRIAQENGATKMHVEDQKGNVQILSAEKLFFAVGRTPNIEGLDLDKIGVKITKKNIITDNTMRTSVKNIYAAGDVVGPYLFSHMAWYQGMIAARNATIPFFKAKIKYDTVAWVTFTAPELARVGLTEKEARERWGSIKVFTKPYHELDRAITDRTTNGLAKYILNKKGRLVGAHIIGARAGEILDELVFANYHDIPFYQIGSIVHVYPTYSEMNWHAAKKAYVDHLENSFFIKLLKKVTGRT